MLICCGLFMASAFSIPLTAIESSGSIKCWSNFETGSGGAYKCTLTGCEWIEDVIPKSPWYGWSECPVQN